MAHTSIWVPGTTVDVGRPDQLAKLIRKGCGTTIKSLRVCSGPKGKPKLSN
jgi:hypothetical protein